eukprot:15358156-Ditylum_brightwellii.AAC.1
MPIGTHPPQPSLEPVGRTFHNWCTTQFLDYLSSLYLHFFQTFCMVVGGRHINAIIAALLVMVRTQKPILNAMCNLVFHLDAASLQEVITATAAISAAAATTSAFSSATSITGLILLELVLKLDIGKYYPSQCWTINNFAVIRTTTYISDVAGTVATR